MLTTSIALALLALSAPRTPYGGNALAFVWGMPLEIDPREGSAFGDVTVAGAIYESLYAIDGRGDLVPVLARELPRLENDQLIVPLREGVLFHDGKPLTAEAVASWLRSLAEGSTRASYVVLDVKGAREKLTTDPKARVRIEARPDGAVAFTLAAPYLDYARLLAAPQAAIAEGGIGVGAGTGPWKVAAGITGTIGQVSLEPFLAHRDGRPFLDALLVRESTSRFGTVTEMKKGDAAIVFGVPDTKTLKRHEIVPWTKGSYPEEIVLLSIGKNMEALRSPEAYKKVSGALNRGILAHRFIGQGAEPATTLLGEDREAEAVEAPPFEASIEPTMLVSKDDRVLYRIAERVQLDLLRAKVRVKIEWAPARTLEARRKDRRYDLLLDSAYPAWAGGNRPIDRFHAALSMTSWATSPAAAIIAEEYATFARASDVERESMLPELERAMRTRAGLIPIAALRPELAVRSDLKSFVLRPFGRLDLADAYFLAPPTRASSP
jgi:peptide/nickel transport system substrate-binding protein